MGAEIQIYNDRQLRYFHNRPNRDATLLIGFCVAWAISVVAILCIFNKLVLVDGGGGNDTLATLPATLEEGRTYSFTKYIVSPHMCLGCWTQAKAIPFFTRR